eukprot:m.155256 g.155256  ORF g.155256 m.155256 type:complete len:89 (-) comp16273_c1_seq2:123-389(-)
MTIDLEQNLQSNPHAANTTKEDNSNNDNNNKQAKPTTKQQEHIDEETRLWTDTDKRYLNESMVTLHVITSLKRKPNEEENMLKDSSTT